MKLLLNLITFALLAIFLSPHLRAVQAAPLLEEYDLNKVEEGYISNPRRSDNIYREKKVFGQVYVEKIEKKGSYATVFAGRPDGYKVVFNTNNAKIIRNIKENAVIEVYAVLKIRKIFPIRRQRSRPSEPDYEVWIQNVSQFILGQGRVKIVELQGPHLDWQPSNDPNWYELLVKKK